MARIIIATRTGMGDILGVYWILACLAVDAALLAAYAFTWRGRKDISAFIYVHKGAIWFIWFSSWALFLVYLGRGPMGAGLARAAGHPIELVRTMFALLGILFCIYLTYLIAVYPFFASLRPSFSKESFGLDWQLDIFVEDKIGSLVDDLPTTPLLLLSMGLAEALQETPPEERLDLLRNLWVQYVPVTTGHRAKGVGYLPTPLDPDFIEPELNRIIKLAMETMTVANNRGDTEQKHYAMACPLLVWGKVELVFAAYWSRRRPFKNTFDLLAQQFSIIRSQYMLATEVPRERLVQYDNPWNDSE